MSSDLNNNYRRARTGSLVLLFFLGISALAGALGMILDPSGEGMGMPPELLDKTPFNSFLIPAIILGIFNGILSLVFAVLILKRSPWSSWLVLFQGGVLFVWMTAEMFMDLFYALLTIPYYLVALLLILCGIVMHKFRTIQS